MEEKVEGEKWGAYAQRLIIPAKKPRQSSARKRQERSTTVSESGNPSGDLPRARENRSGRRNLEGETSLLTDSNSAPIRSTLFLRGGNLKNSLEEKVRVSTGSVRVREGNAVNWRIYRESDGAAEAVKIGEEQRRSQREKNSRDTRGTAYNC